MNEIDVSKYDRIINRNNKKCSSGLKKYLIGLTMRTLIVVIVFFVVAIVYKSDNVLRDSISNYFIKEDISFAKINKIYDKYLGGLLPVKKKDNIIEVFDEKLSFADSSIYHDGVKLSVEKNYLVPILEEGMVVFMGEKENYGNTIIIENLDGIYYWYGNITNSSLKLYDYVEKGSLLGEVNNEFYMVFSKDGNYLNYEEFIF